MFHNCPTNNRVNRLDEWALYIVYDDFQSAFEKSSSQSKPFSIHHHNIQRLLIEMHKALHNIPTNIFGDPFIRNTFNYLDLNSRFLQLAVN